MHGRPYERAFLAREKNSTHRSVLNRGFSVGAPSSSGRVRAAGSPLANAKGIDACVHCGFCLQACPTYLTLEDENDSPRGRIVLMRSLLEGTLAPGNESVETHIAQCLGCRACETVCPSGVPYGHLLEATRATLAYHRPIPFVARLILGVFEHPSLMRLAMLGGRIARATGVARLLSPVDGDARVFDGDLASTARQRPQQQVPRPLRMTVGAIEGCGGSLFTKQIARPTRADGE